MPYVKNIWHTGDEITADLMNHIEDGIYDNSAAFANKEDVSNKVTEISSESTDTEYPSAKAVYDTVNSSGIKMYHISFVINTYDGEGSSEFTGTIHTDLPEVSSIETLNTALLNLVNSDEDSFVRIKCSFPTEGYIGNFISYVMNYEGNYAVMSDNNNYFSIYEEDSDYYIELSLRAGPECWASSEGLTFI